MLPQNQLYVLTGLCLRHNALEGDMVTQEIEWVQPVDNIRMLLHFGNTMGFLFTDITCACCDHHHSNDYFFCMNDDDHILNKCMRLHTENEDIRIFLPNGNLGIFSPRAGVVDDQYVLKVLANKNCCFDDDETVTTLFHFLLRRIKMRTAFRNLYFRCYRKIFKPGGKGAKQQLDIFDTFIREL